MLISEPAMNPENTEEGLEQRNVDAEDAVRKRQEALSLTRLFSKQNTGNHLLYRDLLKTHVLPPSLDQVIRLLLQFDHSHFSVLWFGTNTIILFNEYCKAIDHSDDVNMNSVDLGEEMCPFGPETEGVELDEILQCWEDNFSGKTDLTREDISKVLQAERSHSQLAMFIQAFHAVWMRDFQSQCKADIDAQTILAHLTNLFNEAIQNPGADLKQSEHMQIVRHVLITFTHMASKAYEMISRNLV